MNPERYLELYKKYINGKEDIFGIHLIPVDIDDQYEVVYRMSNPNKISYSKVSLKGWLTEKRNEFNRALGLEEHIMSYFDCKNLYLNNELVNDLTHYFSSIKEVGFRNWKIKVKHGYFTAKISNEDSLSVTNYVEPIIAYVNAGNNKWEKTDLSTAIQHYKLWIQHHSKYDEMEFNYQKFDDIIDEYPTLVDNDWMVQYVVTEFINPE